MTSTTPPLPRLTLRVAFAGARDLDATGREYLETSWTRILTVMSAGLLDARAQTWKSTTGVARFYDRDAAPMLRVVTGLAEGADSVALEMVTRFRTSEAGRLVEPEVAAVLPCDLEGYRASRKAQFRATFDKQAEECAYIIALDGQCERPDPDTPQASRRRSRGYRAQSMLLLRQADLLVAATDAWQAGRAGGTLETVRSALDRDLPVLLIDTARRGTWLIDPFQDVNTALASEPPDPATLERALRARLTRILMDPDENRPRPEDTQHDGPTAHGERLLEEYFYRRDFPPVTRAADGSATRRATFREKVWRWFERRFQRDRTPLAGDAPLIPVQTWRTRATQLNYHYAGLYRGAYLLNYVLAVLAVTLAGVSLVLLGQQHTEVLATVDVGASGVVPPGSPLHAVLLLLAVVKCGLVVTIARNTHQANHGDWNDKMVDYRYLAERLRAMYYLPLLGSFEPPSASPPQYASRVVRQSAVDWLLEAIVRAIAPLAFAAPETFLTGEGREIRVRVLRPDALACARRLRDVWIVQQATYHDRTSRTMDALHRFLDRWGKALNVTVIVFVVIDILLTIGELAHVFPEPLAQVVSAYMPFLVLMAAVLPAAVASLNAVRFQSECRRLADRSAVIRTILRGRDDAATPGGRLLAADQLIAQIEQAQRTPANDPGSWVAEVLRLTETVARDFAEEVGEWSVLYAKELPEP